VLSVEMTTEGLHSGGYGGVVPSTFRILRQPMDRIEDAATGEVLLPEAHVEIPDERLRQAAGAAQILGDATADVPLVAGAAIRAGRDDATILVDRTWRPALEVISAEGLPSVEAAGNVLRPRTALGLSLRIPPRADPAVVQEALGRRLTDDPPYGARVRFDVRDGAAGWDAPATAPWLAEATAEASTTLTGVTVFSYPLHRIRAGRLQADGIDGVKKFLVAELAVVQGRLFNDGHKFALQGTVMAGRPFAQALNQILRRIFNGQCGHLGLLN
jgi:hypothetical protein